MLRGVAGAPKENGDALPLRYISKRYSRMWCPDESPESSEDLLCGDTGTAKIRQTLYQPFRFSKTRCFPGTETVGWLAGSYGKVHTAHLSQHHTSLAR